MEEWKILHANSWRIWSTDHWHLLIHQDISFVCKGLQFLSLPWRKELHELHSKSPGKESMFGAFFIGVDSFFKMCRVAAPNVEVEHLYSCIHFCGIAAGSSVFVRKKNTRVDVSPVEESDGRTWTYHQPPSPGMAWNSRPFKRRCGGKDLW